MTVPAPQRHPQSGRLRIALLGGDGGRSGVPRYIEQICAALGQDAQITVLSDVDRGGYAFVQGTALAHAEIRGLASSMNPLRILRAYGALRRTLRADPPDVIWANARLTLPMARVFMLENRLLRRSLPRLIVTYHGIPFGPGRRPLQSALSQRVETAFLRMTPPHDIVFLSDSDRAAIGASALARHTLWTLPNCSDLRVSALPAPHVRKCIVMTTRHAPQKDLGAAARIFAQLPREYDLVLLGIGTDSAALKQLFAEILPPEAMARVTFAGPVADVVPHLLGADCYLMTSRYEGMSIGALEAFECGLPVAMTDVGGAAEIAAAHPQFARIDAAKAGAAARAIIALVSTYHRDPAAQAKTTRAHWRGSFSFDIWRARVRALFSL